MILDDRSLVSGCSDSIAKSVRVSQVRLAFVQPYVDWLVVSNMTFIFHFIYGMSSFPLTNSIIFQRGRLLHQPVIGIYPRWCRISSTHRMLMFSFGWRTKKKVAQTPPTFEANHGLNVWVQDVSIPVWPIVHSFQCQWPSRNSEFSH